MFRSNLISLIEPSAKVLSPVIQDPVIGLTDRREKRAVLQLELIERIAAMHKADETLADVKARLAIKNLFVPGGASDNFRVLIQKKVASA